VGKPAPDLPDACALARLIDARGELAVRVTPGARSEALVIDSARLTARVRAKPKDGEANAAVARLIAKALKIAPSRVTLLRGATARDKRFRIEL